MQVLFYNVCVKSRLAEMTLHVYTFCARSIQSPSLRLMNPICAHFSLHRVTPRPHILVGHFYAVAIFGTYLIMKSKFPWQLHKGIFRALMVVWKACTVMFPLIGSELKNVFQF